jgi:hypothetical protein
MSAVPLSSVQPVSWGRRVRRLRALPLAFEALALSRRMDRRVRSGGFAAGKELAEELAQTQRSARESPEFIAAVVHRVSKIPVLGRTCLPRSLTLWVLLRRCGYRPTLRLGAMPRDDQKRRARGLAAHAWVELDGRPLGEALGPLKSFDTPPLLSTASELA